MGKMGLKGVPGLNLVSGGGGGRQNQSVRCSISLKRCATAAWRLVQTYQLGRCVPCPCQFHILDCYVPEA